ncbi:hypothetical protein NIES2109_33670 [Nostoc sp. HK-01]|nr:hypothetical protein NIES2109_33670 [Nostoc sp. HK-01]
MAIQPLLFLSEIIGLRFLAIVLSLVIHLAIYLLKIKWRKRQCKLTWTTISVFEANQIV